MNPLTAPPPPPLPKSFPISYFIGFPSKRTLQINSTGSLQSSSTIHMIFVYSKITISLEYSSVSFDSLLNCCHVLNSVPDKICLPLSNTDCIFYGIRSQQVSTDNRNSKQIEHQIKKSCSTNAFSPYFIT